MSGNAEERLREALLDQCGVFILHRVDEATKTLNAGQYHGFVSHAILPVIGSAVRDFKMEQRALAASPSPAGQPELCRRITNYLGNGGFFNPEQMEHAKVRDLLIDCRAALAAASPSPFSGDYAFHTERV